MDVQYLHTILWFYSLMDTSGSKMDQLYVSELRILKATWRTSNHEYVVAIVKNTGDLKGTGQQVLYVMFERGRPRNRRKSCCKRGIEVETEHGGRGGGTNVDNSKGADDILVDQQRIPFERFMTKWRATRSGLTAFLFSFRDVFEASLARGSPSASASVFDPLTSERGAKDLVYILNNPWVHERDEIVAALRLPSPSSLPQGTTPPRVTPESGHPETESHNSPGNHEMKHPMAFSKTRNIPFSTHHHRPLFMFELVVLACTLKDAEPEYRVLTSNCYWYCAMILHIVRLRHGLDIAPIREPKSRSLELFKSVTPNEGHYYSVSFPNTHAPVEEERRKNKISWKWKFLPGPNQKGDGSRGASVDPTYNPISVLCSATPIPAPSQSSQSWYSAKVGRWYVIQVSRPPTEAVLYKWLAKTEEAIEQFKNEVYSVRHNRKFVLQDGAVMDTGILFGSSTREISRLGFIAELNKLTRLEKEDELGLGWEELEHGGTAMALLDMWKEDHSPSPLAMAPGREASLADRTIPVFF